MVIGMRGHAQMIPFGVGCKIVTLGSHKKVRWFLEDIGMEQFYVDINEDIEGLSNRIYDCVSYIHEHREEMDALICEKEKFLWGISEANKKRIKEGV